ncbi:MAG: hypothetical protein FWE42_09360, partial [Defluviitaleaceae bacterium]|nr:hypothetical protein [Defluviitaleaceae bacterium]
MKSLKCDSCGAGLQIQHNKDSITCEYCGTSMIIERPQPAAANTPVPSETPSPISGAETEAKNAELIEKHKAGRYEIAEIHTKAEQYTKALAIFKQLGEINYKDAQHRVSEIEPLALAMRKKRRKRFL